MADAHAACPGKRGRIRPAVALPMCRRCQRFNPDAAGHAPATHNGAQWVCPSFSEQPPAPCDTEAQGQATPPGK